MTHTFLPILIMLIIAAGVGGVILMLSFLLGRHQRNPSKLSPYESGVPLLDQNRKRVNVRFYQIAMLFILFDIEVVFLYPWAVVYKDMLADHATRNLIFGSMVSFLGILFAGYLYALKKKAFDWKS